MNDVTVLLLAAVLLGLNGFFVGAEFALISARRTQIEPMAASGSRLAKITLRTMERISLVIAAVQFGITACSLGLGAIAEPAIAHLLEPVLNALRVPDDALHPISFVVALSIVAYLHVVLGEMVPKNIALATPERAALVLAPPMAGIIIVLKPLVVVLNWVADVLLRLVGVQPKDEVTSTFTREEVAGLVEESMREGLIEADEYDLLAGALGFTERTVASVLLPLDQLATVGRGAMVEDVEGRCAQTGFSRFPVSDEGDLVGYLHIKDVLEHEMDGRGQEIPDTLIRPMITLRTDERLHEALTAMRRRGVHLARIESEQGALAGVVALEDVLEELVGEIRDAAHRSASQAAE